MTIFSFWPAYQLEQLMVVQFWQPKLPKKTSKLTSFLDSWFSITISLISFIKVSIKIFVLPAKYVKEKAFFPLVLIVIGRKLKKSVISYDYMDNQTYVSSTSCFVSSIQVSIDIILLGKNQYVKMFLCFCFSCLNVWKCLKGAFKFVKSR